MSFEFRLDIDPNGNDLRLKLHSELNNVPQGGKLFDRTMPALQMSHIDQLRLGNANLGLVQTVTADVSQWLLGTDLEPFLTQALARPDGEKVRVVLSISDEALRSKLSDVPFELCTQSGAGTIPLALKNSVESIIHLLPKVGQPPLSLNSGTFPLRILVVRSNPADLGGGVPPASGIRDEINSLLDAHQKLDQNLVQVHVLSSEPIPDGIDKPTFEGLKRQLKKTSYDILIYLGHGEVLSVYPDFPPVGVLQFETEDAAAHVSIPFDQLTHLLHERPVPVVLLVGCLTAADVPAAIKQNVEAAIPLWMRGSQAVAQALINSESGVQIAVGMRYRLETVDATRFLKGFFESLFDDENAGNVEAAIRAARSELKQGNPGSYSWSAPMVFSSLAKEPLFAYLAAPPETVCPNFEAEQNLRLMLWENLSKHNWSLRAVPQSGAEAVNTLLRDTEQKYIAKMLAQVACLLQPEYVEGRHGELVTVPVKLHGQLKVDALRGELIFGGGQVAVKSIEPAPGLLARGYQILSFAKDNSASFYLERKTGDADLPEGVLFNATVELGQTYPAVYALNVNVLKTEPQKAICTANNAVIVPPP